MLADGPSSSSPAVIKVPYSSTACGLMNLLSAIFSSLALTDAEKRHSSGNVAAIAHGDTVTSQTTDIVRFVVVDVFFLLTVSQYFVKFQLYYSLAQLHFNVL